MSYEELSNKQVTCRKNYSCGWCAQAVNKGERAQARSYKFFGDMVSDHMHPECYEAMLTLPNDECQDGWTPGDFPRGSIMAI